MMNLENCTPNGLNLFYEWYSMMSQMMSPSELRISASLLRCYPGLQSLSLSAAAAAPIVAVAWARNSTLQWINIDPASHRGWKTSFHNKLVIFRVQLLIYWRVISEIKNRFLGFWQVLLLAVKNKCYSKKKNLVGGAMLPSWKLWVRQWEGLYIYIYPILIMIIMEIKKSVKPPTRPFL